ncbi:glycosyltransferase family 4 protein [Chitinophaga sancti]|uniref:glycosyltransferase family 4 protein n=1 Tax=Chitinophaga sancti TaxID=1004 RepID=UPI002A762C7D|nr:glycosyltransferase family 4 protein [Chitinophaga sancti]WPQ64530.1 glycosyltransferase family 4 protein [Chitinophaga sancti]
MRERKIRISFILPGRGTKPVGGFRVVYEYANRLSAAGFEVQLVHTAWLFKRNPFVGGVIRYLYCLFFYRFIKPWFALEKGVKNKWIFALYNFLLPDADFVVATSWETAEHVAEFPARKGRKLYLIQANESEFTYVSNKGLEKASLETWKLPMHKIAICTWLQVAIKDYSGQDSTVIFNGLNFEEFFIERGVQKNENTVMMLHHHSPHKGSAEGMAALRLLKSRVKDLQVILYGMPAAPDGLEEWMRYYQMPERNELRRLYNEATIFLSPSHSEGWGLPVSEAMQCGCLAVTSDIGGFKDFVKDGQTACCFPVGDVESMATVLQELLLDDEKRKKLAKQGHAFIQQFTWDRAVADFIKVLKME